MSVGLFVGVAAVIVAFIFLAVVIVVVRRWHGRRPLLTERQMTQRQSTRRDSLEAYRAGINASPFVPRSSTRARELISPLDTAMVNGEILRIKPTYCAIDPAYAGLLCRAVGGTRGRPTVEILGAPEGTAFEIDKKYLTRAQLETGADAELEGQQAWQARFDTGAGAVGGAGAVHFSISSPRL